jgi:hypothetical protein
MKKYFYSMVATLSFISQLNVFAAPDTLSREDLQEQMTPRNTEDVIRATQWNEEAIDGTLWFVRDTIFDFLLLIAVGVFLYLWGRLIIARWNPEEFKKALLWLVQAWIGLFVVAAAYAIVTFIAWIDIL